MFKQIGAAISGLFRQAQQKAAVTIADLFGGILKGMDLSKVTDFNAYLTAGSKRCWALFKAVDYIAKAGMDTGHHLQKRGGDGTAVEHRELNSLFANPNPTMNFVEMIYLTIAHMALTGNAFWLKDEVNFKNERPKNLYPLNPKRMQLVIDPKGGLIGYIYRTENRGTEIPLELGEVAHFKIPHVNNDYWGLGVVESAEDLYQGFINRQNWEAKFWKNGAAPSGVLICEDLVTNETKWDAAKARWQKEYGGAENSGRVAWLTGKWKFEKLGLTKTEMQDLESDKWTVEKIAIQCGVPLSVFGIREAANFATSRIDDLRFRRYTVKPMLTFIQKTINSEIVDGFSPDLEFVFAIAGLIDLDNLRENFCPLFDRGGISINELRKLAGLQVDEENPLWESHYILSTYAPLELAGINSNAGQTQAQARAAVNRHVDRKLLGGGAGRSENHDRLSSASDPSGAPLD